MAGRAERDAGRVKKRRGGEIRAPQGDVRKGEKSSFSSVDVATFPLNFTLLNFFLNTCNM